MDLENFRIGSAVEKKGSIPGMTAGEESDLITLGNKAKVANLLGDDGEVVPDRFTMTAEDKARLAELEEKYGKGKSIVTRSA